MVKRLSRQRMNWRSTWGRNKVQADINARVLQHGMHKSSKVLEYSTVLIGFHGWGTLRAGRWWTWWGEGGSFRCWRSRRTLACQPPSNPPGTLFPRWLRIDEWENEGVHNIQARVTSISTVLACSLSNCLVLGEMTSVVKRVLMNVVFPIPDSPVAQLTGWFYLHSALPRQQNETMRGNKL